MQIWFADIFHGNRRLEHRLDRSMEHGRWSLLRSVLILRVALDLLPVVLVYLAYLRPREKTIIHGRKTKEDETFHKPEKSALEGK